MSPYGKNKLLLPGKTVRIRVFFRVSVTPRSCRPVSHERQRPAPLVYSADARILLGLRRAEGFHRFKCGEMDAAQSGLYYVRTSKRASEECCVLREGEVVVGLTPGLALNPAHLLQLRVQTAPRIFSGRSFPAT